MRSLRDRSIELLDFTGCGYSLPIDAFRAIQHHFPGHILAQPKFTSESGESWWRELIDRFVSYGGDTVTIYSRAGFWLKQRLGEAGYDVTLRLARPDAHLLTVHAARLDELMDPMWLLPEMLRLQHFGQFKVAAPADVPRIVHALTAAFPDAPCVLPFASFEQAAAFRDQLGRVVDEPVTLMCGMWRRPRSRLVVTTFQAALSGDYGQKLPMCIVPKWPGGLHQKLKVLARQPDMQRLYLIRTEQDLICPNDVAELLHRIGPILRAFGRHRPRAQHILHTVPFGGRHRPEKVPSEQQIDKKRGMYWRHQRRNQLLASLAHQLASDEESLRTLPADRQHVAVLVELTEHAHKLAGLLRGWPIVTQDDINAPIPPRCIITLIAAKACQTLAPCYLINAGGGPASPWLESWLDKRALARTAIRLVDLSDGFSGEATALSGGRQAGYKRAGAVWRPLAKQFLKPARDALRDSSH